MSTDMSQSFCARTLVGQLANITAGAPNPLYLSYDISNPDSFYYDSTDSSKGNFLVMYLTHTLNHLKL